jgi:signal transduction histidine kinase
MGDPAAERTEVGEQAIKGVPGVRTAERMPNWFGSIRFRLTVTYSIVLFSLASIVVSVIYLGEAHALSDEQLYQHVQVVTQVDGGFIISEGVLRNQARETEHMANERSLELLRNYSMMALFVLFLISLVVGWIVAGSVLKPIGRITGVAKDIQATDLSRRIRLGGPPDELRELADTFDDMLGRLDDAFESQREFIHEASHELRNPLAVIRTNLDVTLADPDADEEELRHTLEVVQRSSERMTRLVDDLLVYARKGSLSLERETLDAGDLVHELADEFRAPAAAKDITVADQRVDGLWVDGDRNALRQALANLLANAIRISPAGTTVRVRGGAEAPWVWLAVEDEGPGIAAEDHERVFQRFWRGDPREGRAEGRSGLGLTIVRQVAESHGGEVKLVSEPGHGAAFAIWLPAAPEPAPSASGAATTAPATTKAP